MCLERSERNDKINYEEKNSNGFINRTQLGGEHQYALTMAECINELSGSIYEIVVITTIGNKFWYDWCKKNYIRYVGIPFPYSRRPIVLWNLYSSLFSRIYARYVTRLGKLINKENIDILLFTDQLNFIPNFNVKIVTPVHDLMHRYEATFPEVKCEYIRRELLFRCQAKYADYVLVDSDLGASQFVESYLQSDKRKPHVISLPFIVKEHILEIKEEYINVPAKFVFYPAQFWKHKNHINLVKAIQILKDEIEDIHLILVGSDKGCYSEVEEYILNHQLEGNITTLGFVSEENMVYLYKNAIGMIMPSYFGPTNIPPLEAMALGCPVAVSSRYAMPEQVGKAGLLFNPDSPKEIADCIRMLWVEKDLREKLIEKGYQRIKQWSKKDFENKLLKILDECLHS